MDIANILTRLAPKIPKVYDTAKTDFGYKKSASGTRVYIDDININEKKIDVNLTSNTVTDFSKATITVGSKNLVPFDSYKHLNYNANGITAVAREDGGIVLNGTPNADIYLNLWGGLLYYDSLTYWNSNGFACTNINSGRTHVAYDANTRVLFINIQPGQSFTNVVIYPQIVIGNKLGAFEKGMPFQRYKPTADGKVELNTLYPNMSILPTVRGVTLNTEYYADSEKVVQNLTDTIISLGGTV
ncbi:MAG: hypothetical protein J6Q27_04085 [Clostridia bacterium]|nr:hypothetical protein [Clostridia bacterium]